jgi:hypothetical protein
MLATSFRTTSLRRLLRGAAAVTVLALASACDDDATGPDEEPEIESVRLTVTPPSGTATTYVLTANGSTPSPVQLRVGTSTLTAVALGAGGQALDIGSEFELRMGGLPASVTFTRNGSLTATVSATAAVATPVTAQAIMWHKVENHDDYTASFR